MTLCLCVIVRKGNLSGKEKTGWPRRIGAKGHCYNIVLYSLAHQDVRKTHRFIYYTVAWINNNFKTTQISFVTGRNNPSAKMSPLPKKKTWREFQAGKGRKTKRGSRVTPLFLSFRSFFFLTRTPCTRIRAHKEWGNEGKTRELRHGWNERAKSFFFPFRDPMLPTHHAAISLSLWHTHTADHYCLHNNVRTYDWAPNSFEYY